jgi:hypothetical protein
MYDNLREAAQALVRNRFVVTRNFVRDQPPARLVFRHSTHASSLVMLPPFVQKLSRAVQPSPSLVRVDAFGSPCYVGGVSRAQLGARLPLPLTVRTSVRLRSATLVLQRHLASILTHTNRIATLRIQMTSWPFPGITESSLSWSRRPLLSTSTHNLTGCQTNTSGQRRFVSSDKRVQVLPHMPESKRKFVHDVSCAPNPRYSGFFTDRTSLSLQPFTAWIRKWSTASLIAAYS